MATENQALPRLLNENVPSSEHTRSEALVVKLARFYSVMGSRPDEPGALALMAEILCQSASDEQITHAMTRCVRECRYPVRLSDFLQRIPSQEVLEPEAEARKAWDLLISFLNKWVQSDPEGNYVITRGVRSTEPPMLSQRITDTVRRTGGWRVYKTMNQDDYPHQQKRFFEEYGAWAAVEQILPANLLTEMPRLQLAVKPIEQLKAEILSAPSKDPIVVKRLPEPLTEPQIHDRREMLRQQRDWLQGRGEGKITRPGPCGASGTDCRISPSAQAHGSTVADEREVQA